ncbi:hypothetical protein LX36DRAFT_431359 [Colletotrichum falcatum]|nr:hypothetical protein LX36DRAFT_431359 [Colletotrichum falcatum]
MDGWVGGRGCDKTRWRKCSKCQRKNEVIRGGKKEREEKSSQIGRLASATKVGTGEDCKPATSNYRVSHTHKKKAATYVGVSWLALSSAGVESELRESVGLTTATTAATARARARIGSGWVGTLGYIVVWVQIKVPYGGGWAGPQSPVAVVGRGLRLAR